MFAEQTANVTHFSKVVRGSHGTNVNKAMPYRHPTFAKAARLAAAVLSIYMYLYANATRTELVALILFFQILLSPKSTITGFTPPYKL